MNADNTNWIQLFDITEINKHQRGFVVYKVISILYPKRCPEAVTKLSVWKRYNDFKKLYRDMKILHGNYNLPDKFPSLCRGTFFKKYDEHSITEKKQSALNFLEYIGSHHQLFTSKEFVKFFETSYMPINHLNGNISSIKADLNLPDDPEFVRNSDDELNSDSDSISTLSSVNLLDTSSSSLISDRLARNASSRTPGSPQSLQILKNCRTHSEVCSNEDDFMKYVEELETNGNYEEAHKTCVTATDFLRESLSNENDYDKKRSIQHRIELCCLRAERLYNMYLSPEVKNLLSKVDPVIKRSSLQKPAISEIYKYNVIRKEESGMLVLHPDTQKKFYVKVINKTTSFSDDNLIIPESIPYMVQLHNFYNCDNSIFLILEYVKGSKLSDYLNKVRLKFENNETVENLYDKAVDLDIPDDDSENSFTDLVTKYTKVKTDIESNDFEVISKDDISQTVHPVSLPQTESTFSYRQRSSSIPTINIEAEQNVDLLQHEIIVKWAAQLILALEKLHTLGIICKDLRLHNLLINEKGNLTLTYMCNAKDSYDIFINKRDLNLAPEVQGIGPEGEEADWWSFGAIFYEILVGMSINDLHPEYFHQTTILRIPKYVSPEGRSLLRQLLVYEPKKRLGAGPHGVDNLKSHPFFKGIDWNALLEQSFN